MAAVDMEGMTLAVEVEVVEEEELEEMVVEVMTSGIKRLVGCILANQPQTVLKTLTFIAIFIRSLTKFYSQQRLLSDLCKLCIFWKSSSSYY